MVVLGEGEKATMRQCEGFRNSQLIFAAAERARERDTLPVAQHVAVRRPLRQPDRRGSNFFPEVVKEKRTVGDRTLE
jgi:hypothetical protein